MPDIRDELAAAARRLEKAADKILDAGVKEAVRSIQGSTLFKDSPAKTLRRNLRIQGAVTGFRFARRLVAEAEHASWVNDGTRPHVISASEGSVLRFRTKSGRWVAKQSVNHPGIAPRHFMEEAERAGEMRMAAVLDRVVQDALNG